MTKRTVPFVVRGGHMNGTILPAGSFIPQPNNINYAWEIEQKETLRDLMKQNMIDTGDVEAQIEQLKKERVLERHSSKITPPSEKDKYWRTRVKTEDGKYRKVRATSRDGLIEKLYRHYFTSEDQAKTKVTLMDMWDYYKKEALSTGSVDEASIYREDQRYRRYFAGRPSERIPIRQFDEKKICEVIEDLIREFDLNWKETKAVKGVLSAAFKCAVKHQILQENPAANIKALNINRNLCAATIPKGDKSRCYSRKEFSDFITAAYERLEKYPSSLAPAAAILNTRTGLRIGELVALKFSDVDFENQYLRIRRMATVDKDGKPIIVEHGKGKNPWALRKIALTEECLDLIRYASEINQKYGYGVDDYIFCNKDGPLTRRAVDHAIRRICYSIGMPEAKSSHDIRRTVITLLYEELGHGALDAIRRFAGHASVEQTLSYIYGMDTTEEEDIMIRNVFKKEQSETASLLTLPSSGREKLSKVSGLNR